MLPIHERFHTWQGEGVHMGRNAFFIRLFGCPMHCPWCDSAGTWHPDFVPDKINKMEEGMLLNEVLLSRAEMVVITGGEPAIHDLTKLTALLREQDIKTHIETSGAFKLRGYFSWVTVSPKNKWAKPMLPENLDRASEFKLIIEGPDDIPYWATILNQGGYRDQVIWMHPEWSRRNDASVLNAITEQVKTAGGRWRAGWQLHKLYRSDSLDTRSAPLVPLGGNPQLGF